METFEGIRRRIQSSPVIVPKQADTERALELRYSHIRNKFGKGLSIFMNFLCPLRRQWYILQRNDENATFFDVIRNFVMVTSEKVVQFNSYLH